MGGRRKLDRKNPRLGTPPLSHTLCRNEDWGHGKIRDRLRDGILRGEKKTFLRDQAEKGNDGQYLSKSHFTKDGEKRVAYGTEPVVSKIDSFSKAVGEWVGASVGATKRHKEGEKS